VRGAPDRKPAHRDLTPAAYAASVLERRNRLFRVLYDTVVEVEGREESDIHPILCRNLLRICDAEAAALLTFDETARRLVLGAVCRRDESLPEIPEPGHVPSQVLGEEVRASLARRPIQESPDPELDLSRLIPTDFTAAPSGGRSPHLQQVSMIQDHELVALGIVRLPQKEKLRTKDIVESYLSLAAIVIQRANAVHRLRESEERFRTVADFTYHWEYWLGPDGCYVYVSPSCERITGYAAQEFFDDPKLLYRITLPEDRDLLIAHHREEPRQGAQRNLDFRIIARNGEEKWIVHNCQAVYSADGRWLGTRGTNRDETQRKLAEKHLHESLRFRERLLETAVTAIFTVDPERRITNVNRAFCEITGFTESEIIGQPCARLDCTYCQQYCRLFDPERQVAIRKTETTIHTKDGQRLTILKNAEVILDQQGRPSAGIESFVDVTELASAREQAESANRAKSAFLANTSHEIRTPLNGVIGMLSLLAESDLDDLQREYLAVASSSAETLHSVLNDILDLSKIEAGKLTMEEIPFEIRRELKTALEPWRLQAGEKGLAFVLRVDDSVPEKVVGDPGRLRQILTNLVGNALKFTDSGSIEVDVRCADDMDHRGAELQFSVRDTGIGIPAEKRQVIFEAFSQVDGSTTRRYGGTGLGLCISDRLVTMMGGRIWVDTASDGGSIFYFTVKLDVAKESSPPFPAGKPS
jgi:PAS domain S-box-containing protein